MLADKCPACCDNPILSSLQGTNQYVEMNAGGFRRPVEPTRSRLAAHALKRQPLTIRRRLERDPARIPLDRRPTQQSGPEPRKCPWIRAVKHNLAYPADCAKAVVAHARMMTHYRPCGGQTGWAGLQFSSGFQPACRQRGPSGRRSSLGHWAGGRPGRERTAHGGDATQARAMRGGGHQGWSGANAPH